MKKKILVGGALLIIIAIVSYLVFSKSSPLRQLFTQLSSLSSQTAAAIDEGIIYQRDAATSYTASGPGTDIGDIGGGLNAITVSAWVEPSQTSGVYHIVSKYGSSDASWALWYSGVSSAYLFTTLSSTGAYAQPFSILSNPGGLHHIVGVYDGSNSRLYIDGVLAGNSPQPMTGSIKNTGIPVCIGSQGGAGCTSGSYFPGTVSKVRVYNKALSASEVGELFTSQGGTTVQPPVVVIPPVIDPPVVIPPTDTQTNPPTVSITSPGSGTTISSSPTVLSATAAGQSGKTIAGVQFKVNGSNVGSEDTSSPYTASWTSTGLSAGTYSVTATARDSAGITTVSSPISLIISSGPTVQPAAERVVSWTPPVGIPEPPFGIREDVTQLILRSGQTCQSHPNKCYNYGNGAEPYRLNSIGEPYTHYVDNSSYPNCDISDDASNEGTPARPLCRLPLQIPAGAIVEVHGVFGGNGWHHLSPGHININGTASRPAYIRSMTGIANRARIITPWEVTGTYGIIENLFFDDADGVRTGGGAGNLSLFGGVYGPTLKYSPHHISIRHNEVYGNLDTIGINVSLLPVPTTANPSISEENHVVVWDNYVHHTGDVYSPTDKDVGGIKMAGKWMWAVDNKCHDNGNACVFTGGGNGDTVAPLNEIQYVFIGRNNGYANREANFFTKQASHVVFSENTSGVTYDFRGPGDVYRGGGMGYQYGPRDVWFINNKISDGSAGILVGSDGVETTQDAYFIGNVISNIHKNSGQATPQGAINIGGGLNHYILNNTIDGVDLGIYVGTNGQKYISGNIISNTTSGGSLFGHMALNNEHGSMAPRITNNLFYQSTGSPKIYFPSLSTTVAVNNICGTQANCSSAANLSADPQYVNQSAGNFALQANSPASDVGNTTLLQEIAVKFQSIYNVDIRKDILGNQRIAGPSIDIGAYEYGSTGGIPTNPSLAITGIAVSSITTSGALITWNTNVPATSQVRYGLTTSYGSLSALITSPLLQNHAVSLIRLSPNTTYNYQVISKDANGVTVEGPNRTFTTSAGGVVVLPPTNGTTTPPVILGASSTVIVTRPTTTTSTPKPITSTTLTPITKSLSKGDTGQQVVSLQHVLKAQGYIITISGVFDSTTISALKVFQWKYNLAVPGDKGYGTTDEKTRAKVNSLMKNLTVSVTTSKAITSSLVFKQDLSLGMTSPDVMVLQQFLNNKGYTIATIGAGSKGNESTYFGTATEKALIRFQKDQKISPATGIFSGATREIVNALAK